MGIKEIVNATKFGDIVIDNNTKSEGFVKKNDIITNEGGEEPRAFVSWHNQNGFNPIKDGWICEGNLTLKSTMENLYFRNYSTNK